jgi:starch synthase
MSVDLVMAAEMEMADVVHSHTWYTNLAGHLVKVMHDIPHVVTVHSLEPLRPWKAEQLGSGYAISGFCERTGVVGADAVIAVSHAMAADVRRCYPELEGDVRVIHHGVDTAVFRPDPEIDVLERFGIDPLAPTVVFVGRITPQKGLSYLLDAAGRLDPSVQLVLRAGPADTPAMASRVAAGVAALSETRRVIWIQEDTDRRQLAQLLSHATVAVCPSVYEPFGLVNVEAMACETAVVASAVGGITETVEHGVTGLLVPFEPSGDSRSPRDPEGFVRELAGALDQLLSDPARAEEMGRAGRKHVLERFTWGTTATATIDLYRALGTAG